MVKWRGQLNCEESRQSVMGLVQDISVGGASFMSDMIFPARANSVLLFQFNALNSTRLIQVRVRSKVVSSVLSGHQFRTSLHFVDLEDGVRGELEKYIKLKGAT